MKIGILGGTFDPIHNAHLKMAIKAYEKYDLDDVIIIPSGTPPHKNSSSVTGKEDRYEMCILATMYHDNMFVSTMEMERKGYTYTVDTLKYFKNFTNRNSDIYFIIGGDTVLELETWKDYKEVFKLCKFLAFSRKGIDKEKILKRIDFLKKEYNADIIFDNEEIPQISSSYIRESVSKDKDIKQLVPDRVREYIYDNRLYKG